MLFLNIKDGKISKNVDNNEVLSKVESIIKKYNPRKIFTHSRLDPHIDHRGVNKITLGVIDKLNYKGDVYAFEVWNVVKEDMPAMYVNITPYFKKKIKAMKMFRSQLHFIYFLLIPVYWRAVFYGMKNSCRYAEKFYKIK